MEMQTDADVEGESWYVSTGHLPSPAQIQRWVDEAYDRYRSITDGENTQVYPALARVPSDLFGICAVGTSGNVYMAGRRRTSSPS
jgi:glutaminase